MQCKHLVRCCHSFPQCVIVRARKRKPNPNILIWISSGGVGVFHVKGRGPKSSVGPLKPKENRLSDGISRESWRDILGRGETFEKKSSCSSFGPYDCEGFSEVFRGSGPQQLAAQTLLVHELTLMETADGGFIKLSPSESHGAKQSLLVQWIDAWNSTLIALRDPKNFSGAWEGLRGRVFSFSSRQSEKRRLKGPLFPSEPLSS